MRLPTLPVFIDEFPALRARGRHASSLIELFFLSHFHTDHMKGLHAAWSSGFILTSTITKQLLLGKFDGLRGRVLGLPFWCRMPLLRAAASAKPKSSATACEDCAETVRGDGEHDDDDAPSVNVDFVSCSSAGILYVTLLPAFHIPGSAMMYFELPSGVTYLYTGDFKFTESEGSLLRSFLRTHRVDHLYLDDTWLHLGHAEITPWYGHSQSMASDDIRENHRPEESGWAGGGGRVQVLSKLLNREQVAEAIEAVGRRMDHQRSLFMQWQRAHTTRSTTTTTTTSSSSSSGASHTRLPFVLRVYLHNQFGKELLIQQLAQRLRTRAVIDDVRYARLLTVVEALEEERDDLHDFPVDARQTADPAGAEAPSLSSSSSPPTAAHDMPLSPEELAWRAAGGEAAQYPYDLNCFMSVSQAAALFASAVSLAEEAPLIEVVGTRADVDPAVLQQASEARGGTPHYGVLISGWARLQPQSGNNKNNSDYDEGGTLSSLARSSSPLQGGQQWHIPCTLHNTPQELIDFVALLRPLSVTPLHYRPSRAAVVLQRLGPYLRTPFVNRYGTAGQRSLNQSAGDDGGDEFVACWTLCLPRHVVCQNRAEAAVATGSAPWSCRDGLDALAERPQLGYRIRTPSETGVVMADETEETSDEKSETHGSSSTVFSPCCDASLLQALSGHPGERASTVLTSVLAHVPPLSLRHLTSMYTNVSQEHRGKRTRVEHTVETPGNAKKVEGSVWDATRDVASPPLQQQRCSADLTSLSQIADELL